MADALRNEPGLEVELIDGARSEFSVSVDGREVARKDYLMPQMDEVIEAVRKAGSPAGTGA